MSESTYRKPLPRPNRLSQPFWDGAKQHELRLQRCTACGHIWFPPSPRCPQCLSADYEWAKASGRGRVWSWISMWQKYFPAFESEIPYNVAYVQLEEGPKLMTNIVDCNPNDLRCDLPVEVVFEDITVTVSLPKFRPLR
ncbi:MAG TPA: Zn-ribbon domain-containing OB-fold protein [Dehalococcoidia bacterium]|nr:Zn-ribbon domain-containing OB-fold protein [Dehalococcoidia bacterium]